MKKYLALFFLLITSTCFAGDPTTTISVSFTGPDGKIVTSTAEHLEFSEPVTIPLFISEAKHWVVKIEPLYDKEQLTNRILVTITDSSLPMPPQAALATTIFNDISIFESGKPASLMKSNIGTVSVTVTVPDGKK